MKKLKVFTPFWAVGPECGCISVTLAQYVFGTSTQWGFQVGCIQRPPFIIISPLVIKVLEEISIGSDSRELVYEDTIHEFTSQFRESKPEGCFHSGPITGLFPHEQYHLAVQCSEERGNDSKNPDWKKSTGHIVETLINKFGLPFLRFNSYEEFRCRNVHV